MTTLVGYLKILGLIACIVFGFFQIFSRTPSVRQYTFQTLKTAGNELKEHVAHDPYNQLVDVPRDSILVFDPAERRANATILSLVRSKEVNELVMTMKEVEETFNHKFNYPWTFLNDEPFTEEFKKLTSEATNSTVYYETIPANHWNMPDFVSKELAIAAGQRMLQQGVQYANMMSYHNMCRWNSGLFYHHPRLQQFKYYWRVEPNTHYYCDIDYDLFRYMEDNEKTYGFTISLYDDPNSIVTLWNTTMDFLSDHIDYLHPNSALGYLLDNSRPDHNKIAGYSTNHFWSNFEIGDMDFFRSEPYTQFFNALDVAGGFYYERWGDAPVHTIGLVLFEDKHKIHWFRDIGYRHIPFINCPNSPKCKNRCPTGDTYEGASFLADEVSTPIWWKYAHMN
ncbi:glycosyltransferase family 15 protein [Tortispora caseinolytica NRRL Y-17796]|uniref:Glycosyltransferase family 15 protein n=1 Tax=Tortispora caseinolytica NRRL Y-17796 TaxID=767744 RepID=A0A1E4TAB7_9ASCO|nr:glycosyltransferase family 15 protein [Tortispora caseinolytica NRRL Y-17796]